MSPRLILLNGLPAVGKTTLARRYAEDHPWTLVADLDTLRRAIGGWRRDPTRAGLLARALSLTMAAEHLRAGHDVVVPQFLGRPQFLTEAERVAAQVGALFVEVVLTDDRDTLVDRFARRTAAAVEPAHADAGWLVDQAGGTATLLAMYDRMLQIVALRRDATVLPCPEGEQEQVYRQLIDVIEARALAHRTPAR